MAECWGGFIQSLRDRDALKDDEHYYAFSEFKDSDAPWFEDARTVDTADEVQVPYGAISHLGVNSISA